MSAPGYLHWSGKANDKRFKSRAGFRGRFVGYRARQRDQTNQAKPANSRPTTRTSNL